MSGEAEWRSHERIGKRQRAARIVTRPIRGICHSRPGNSEIKDGSQSTQNPPSLIFGHHLDSWVIFHSTNARSHWIKDNISNPNLNNSILLKNANLNNSTLLKNANLNNSILLKSVSYCYFYC